jgi:hypothetical protein
VESLELRSTEYTPEITAGVVDVFHSCFLTGIKWMSSSIYITHQDQNRFLHLILSEARHLRQFKEVKLVATYNFRRALTNDTAMELRAMMSYSEQGLERLILRDMWLLPGVLSTLSQGLRVNRV